MTWTKTSDDFADDCWTLSDRAYRLHHEGLTWSNRKLLDCNIPRDDVRRFARNGEDGIEELLNCGWWSAVGDHYVINHHATYQRTREEVLKRQAASRQNARRGGRPRKPGREIVEPRGNLVGKPLAEPGANPQGQDRTGLEGNEVRDSEDLDRSDEYMETWGTAS